MGSAGRYGLQAQATETPSFQTVAGRVQRRKQEPPMGTAGKLDHSASVRHILHPAAINLSLGNALFLCPTENRQET